MKSIFEIFDSKAIAAYWTDVNTAMKNPMIGSQFFPNNKIMVLSLHGLKVVINFLLHCNRLLLIPKRL